MAKAKLILNNDEIELPIITGSESETAIDITQLRKETGYITFDPGFAPADSSKWITNAPTLSNLNIEGSGVLNLSGSVSIGNPVESVTSRLHVYNSDSNPVIFASG